LLEIVIRSSEKGHQLSFDLSDPHGKAHTKEYIHQNEQAEYKQEELGVPGSAEKPVGRY
jgi:hypothetical protein